MSERNLISRRDFLKLMGYLSIVSLGGFGAFSELYKKRGAVLSSSVVSPPSASTSQLLLQNAYAQTGGGGSWTLGQNTTVIAIHVALTNTGKIFYLAGSGNCPDNGSGPYTARLLDPATGSETDVTMSDDLWCGGAAQLPNGNILFVGGTQLYDTDVNNCNGKWHGGNYAYEFDILSGTLIKQTSMAHGRWYPTLVTLPNGNVLVVSGSDEYGGGNYLAEVYDSTSKSWTIKYDPTSNNTYCLGAGQTACPGGGSPCYGGPNQGTAPWLGLYPRMNLMPSGLVFQSGQIQQTHIFDPSWGAWTSVNATLQYRDYGTSILLPLQNTTTEKGKVMLVGGSANSLVPSTSVVEIEDFNQGTSTAPVLRTVPSIKYPRKYVLPIILPNGKVVIFGGAAQGYVYIPEMFDPENESQGWISLPAATVGRTYHAVALLLPDGSVWTASSTTNRCTGNEYRTEIFKPAYFSASRPTISGSVAVGSYGQTITVPTPNPSGISRVSLVRLGATTHHFDTNVRLIWLQITARSSNSVTVSAPLNANLAPPGYYMIHVLDSSLVPSTAQIIQIPGIATSNPPAQVLGLAVTSAGSSQLNLSWTASTAADLSHYNVYRSTTNGFTVNTATDTPIATPTINSYYDTRLISSTKYYYKVAAVNTSGLIGPLSAQASAETGPPQVTGLRVSSAGSSQLNLSWTAITAADLSHYNVYRSTTNGFTVNTATDTPIATPTINSYYDTGLSNFTTYYYRVAAVNTSGLIGPLSAQASAETGPPQVTGLTITTPAGTSSTYTLNLSWTAITAADLSHYNVYRSTTNGFTVNTATDIPLSIPTTNSYSGTRLTYSTTYYYRVAAVNNSGSVGDVSDQISGTTPADTSPPSVNITTPINGATLPHGDILVQGTSKDNYGGSGVNTIAVSVDSGSYLPASPSAPGDWSTYSITVSIATTGHHTLTARATDKSGNIAISYKITITTT
jgi:fibronectin type 3 domain-containing protein